MNLFLRILTLLTFAAHAVLGCCLSHGGCMLHPEHSHVESCCEHSHTSEHGHDETNSGFEAPSDSGAGSDTASNTAPVQCSTERERGSGPCHDPHCVFDVAVRSVVLLDWKASADICWLEPIVDCKLVSFSAVSVRTLGLGGPPNPFPGRASLQVWLI